MNVGKRILIVEQDRAMRRLLAVILQRSNYEPLEAEDGAAGIIKSCSEQPDLILLDLRLRDIPVTEVVNEIKKDSRTCKIPVVSHTPWAMTFPKRGAFGGRFQKYFVEPAAERMLMEMVKNSINPLHSERSGTKPVAELYSEQSEKGHLVELEQLEVDPELYPFAWLANPKYF